MPEHDPSAVDPPSDPRTRPGWLLRRQLAAQALAAYKADDLTAYQRAVARGLDPSTIKIHQPFNPTPRGLVDQALFDDRIEWVMTAWADGARHASHLPHPLIQAIHQRRHARLPELLAMDPEAIFQKHDMELGQKIRRDDALSFAAHHSDPASIQILLPFLIARMDGPDAHAARASIHEARLITEDLLRHANNPPRLEGLRLLDEAERACGDRGAAPMPAAASPTALVIANPQAKPGRALALASPKPQKRPGWIERRKLSSKLFSQALAAYAANDIASYRDAVARGLDPNALTMLRQEKDSDRTPPRGLIDQAMADGRSEWIFAAWADGARSHLGAHPLLGAIKERQKDADVAALIAMDPQSVFETIPHVLADGHTRLVDALSLAVAQSDFKAVAAILSHLRPPKDGDVAEAGHDRAPRATLSHASIRRAIDMAETLVGQSNTPRLVEVLRLLDDADRSHGGSGVEPSAPSAMSPSVDAPASLPSAASFQGFSRMVSAKMESLQRQVDELRLDNSKLRESLAARRSSTATGPAPEGRAAPWRRSGSANPPARR